MYEKSDWTVWKYELGPRLTKIQVPIAHRILSAKMVNNILCVYILLKPNEQATETLTFLVRGTGDVVVSGENLASEKDVLFIDEHFLEYLGTEVSSNNLVWHIFQLK